MKIWKTYDKLSFIIFLSIALASFLGLISILTISLSVASKKKVVIIEQNGIVNQKKIEKNNENNTMGAGSGFTGVEITITQSHSRLGFSMVEPKNITCLINVSSEENQTECYLTTEESSRNKTFSYRLVVFEAQAFNNGVPYQLADAVDFRKNSILNNNNLLDQKIISEKNIELDGANAVHLETYARTKSYSETLPPTDDYTEYFLTVFRGDLYEFYYSTRENNKPGISSFYEFVNSFTFAK